MRPETLEERAAQLAERDKPLHKSDIRAALKQALATVQRSRIKSQAKDTRMDDVWQPLLAIANAAGDAWAARAAEALTILSTAWEQPDPPAFRILRKVADVTREGLWPHANIDRKQLFKRAGFTHSPATEKQMVEHLAFYQVRIKTVRVSRAAKGYCARIFGG